MRLGRVLTRRDDRLEGGALGAAPAHGGVELQGEVLLGDALAHERQHLEQGGVGDGGGPLHAGDLAPASLRSRSASTAFDGGDQLVAVQELGPAALPAPGDVAGLESDPTGARALERRERGLALLGAGADGDLDLGGRTGSLYLLGRLRAVAAVGGQQRDVAGDDEDARRAREAREVAHVGQRRDHEGVDLVLVEGRPQAVQAAGHGDRGSGAAVGAYGLARAVVVM